MTLGREQIFAVLLFIGMFFWGASWPASKILTSHASIEVVAFWRFFFALITFLPIIVLLGIPLFMSLRSFLLMLVASVANSIYSLLFFNGLSYGLAGAGGVLVTTLIPVFSYLLSYIFLGSKISMREGFGLLLGFLSGLFLLNLAHYGSLLGGGNLFFVAAALTWGVLTLLTQKLRGDVHPVAINFYTTLFSTISFSPVLFGGESFSILAVGMEFWFCLLFVAVFSTAFGTTIYYQAIAVVGAGRASSFGLLVPVHALVLSWIFLDEVPTFETLIGGILAFGAIYMINLYKPAHFSRFKR
ncbi:MAG: DMT family transporter [Wolinella sp.]